VKRFEKFLWVTLSIVLLFAEARAIYSDYHHKPAVAAPGREKP
jgi:hypothetical protein